MNTCCSIWRYSRRWANQDEDEDVDLASVDLQMDVGAVAGPDHLVDVWAGVGPHTGIAEEGLHMCQLDVSPCGWIRAV